MSAGTKPTQTIYSSPWQVWLIAILLLALYAGLAWSASLKKGVSFDEGEELAVGYNIWQNHDFRMEGANGDFVKRWATLPFLISHPSFPGKDDVSWREADTYVLGYNFLFASGNQPTSLLRQGRAMIVLLGLAAGLLVFYCSLEIFGPVGALFSLALFVFSPDMLAFGAIVSTEMSICLALLGSTWSIWRLLHRVTWGRLLAGMGFLGLLFLAKATALVIFPITGVLLLVKILPGRPLEWQLGRPRIIHSRAAQAGVFGALFIVFGIWCWGCLWAHYDFRYAANPNAEAGIAAQVHASKASLNPSVEAGLDWCRQTHVLPQGYLDGIELLLSENKMRETFMNGVWTLGSTPVFFPYTLWAKTPPVLWLFTGLGLAWWLRRKIGSARKEKSIRSARSPQTHFCYGLAPYLVLAVVFAAVALLQNLDIAHRHILPIYPPIFILAGGLAGMIWVRHRQRANVVISLLMLWYVGDAWAIYPNYLAYFSPVVGGSSQGYRRLSESSLDWGMDLPGLKSWLDKNNPGNREAFYLSYFGTDNPDYYGIQSTRLPSFPAWQQEGVYDLQPGVYAISATIFQSFYTETRGPWNQTYEDKYQQYLDSLQLFNASAKDPALRANMLKKHSAAEWVRTYDNFKKLRFARLCAWLRHHHKPDANIGHSILIWRLNKEEIDEALNGKPAEMVNDSPWIADPQGI